MTAPRITLYEMERFALNEANRIETTQQAMIRNGDRTTPHPDKMFDREICLAIVRLVDLCRTDEVAAALKAAAAKASA
jgi:hypothetical protein